jgi:hypothetical protein
LQALAHLSSQSFQEGKRKEAPRLRLQMESSQAWCGGREPQCPQVGDTSSQVPVATQSLAKSTWPTATFLPILCLSRPRPTLPPAPWASCPSESPLVKRSFLLWALNFQPPSRTPLFTANLNRTSFPTLNVLCPMPTSGSVPKGKVSALAGLVPGVLGPCSWGPPRLAALTYHPGQPHAG